MLIRGLVSMSYKICLLETYELMYKQDLWLRRCVRDERQQTGLLY